MKLSNLILLSTRCRIRTKTLLSPLRFYSFQISTKKCVLPQTQMVSTCAPQNMRIYQDDSSSDEDIDSYYMNTLKHEGYARDLLYKDTKDILLNRIYCCMSVQELFNVLESNLKYYKCEDLTQTVFVLYDLMRIYCDVAVANKKSLIEAKEEFLKNLLLNGSFQKFVNLIEEKIYDFDCNTLSYCVFYLRKLGLNLETKPMQLMTDLLRKKLEKEFSIGPTSRYLETVFDEVNLRSHFMSQELIPFVINEIGSCRSANTLRDLTVSLNKLHRVVTNENLDKYKEKVEVYIKNRKLESSDYKVLLQIIAFLNYPKWREKNSVLISKCIILLKNSMHNLNLSEILLLFEIFFKIQEPGDILNNLQRCSSKYFHQLDNVPTKEKLTLLSILIYFVSPNFRSDFQKKLKKYVHECNDYDNLMILMKIITYIKTVDEKICKLYWDKVLKFVKTDFKNVDIVKLTQNYINFSHDMNNYRHQKFETEILNLISILIKDVNYEFFPQKMANFLSFALLYSDDKNLLQHLVTKLENNWEQLKHIDCLKLSISLRIFNEIENKYRKLQYARRIDKVVDKLINKLINGEMSNDLWRNNALLKSCIFKNKIDTVTTNHLLNNYKKFENITSKNIDNIYYCFLMTNSLIPEVIDNMTEYIVTYRDHILGFNVSRVIYMCYILGYQPKKSAELFENAINIIIRDQERMTGLALIYVALALCYFNKLPNSLLKSIFNVEFMDKLDIELQKCYAKDKYPQRVRFNLMQLNRAVCLDYPESNIPWFHQKYMEENFGAGKRGNNLFVNKVREYLRRLVTKEEALLENVITAYGYQIDFVINLNSRDEVVTDSSEITKRLALLLLPEFAYTKIVTQLKGNFQMKKRHLEILGYKVIFLKCSDWIGLYYAEERLDFLRQLIWPNECKHEINKETLR